MRDRGTRLGSRGGLFNRVRRRGHAVEGGSFDLHPGETLALVGESGCGKSTTGRSLLRLVESESGLIEFDGGNVRDLPPGQLRGLRRNIQFLFQDPYEPPAPRLPGRSPIMVPLLAPGPAPRRRPRRGGGGG
ncbi:ATP-binding cassette domain-containing protein, partial [Methylobacterium radiotolerans]|uniref:ATP-binding cassette domain-containing protein n=1 Tax=Methylobacterium radiotolerans TaxID=31998 RepID=UPI003F67543F